MKERKYGKWAGNEKGVPEDKTRCIETIFDNWSWGGRQCARKRGYGENFLYCKQHSKNLKG